MTTRVLVTHGTARINRLFVGSDPAQQALWMDPLADFLRSKAGASVSVHFWSGRLWGPWSSQEIAECGVALDAFWSLVKPGDTAVIIAKSNGAQLIQHAMARTEIASGSERTLLEIRLATPLRGSDAHASRFSRRYLVTSPNDSMYSWGRRAFRPFCAGSDYADRSMVAVECAGLTHHDFNTNVRLKSSSDSSELGLYELYLSMLSGDSDDWLARGFVKVV